MKSDPVPCGMNYGTQITVENMFYNMPLRQKALQKFSEEFNKVEEVVKGYAIHNSSVSFLLMKLGQKDIGMKTSSNSTISKNIGIIFGSEVARNIMEEQGHDELFQFKYHIIVSNLKYSSRTSVFLLFVNHRLVNSDGLRKDINELYSIYLPQKKKPFVYIGLEMNPELVDVNVHPSKEKVFYLHEDSINKKIITVVKEAILGKKAYKAYQSEIEILKFGNHTCNSEDIGNHNSFVQQRVSNVNENVSEPDSQVQEVLCETFDNQNLSFQDMSENIQGVQDMSENIQDSSHSQQVQNRDDYEQSVEDLLPPIIYDSFNPLLESGVGSVDKSDISLDPGTVLLSCNSSTFIKDNNEPTFKPKEAPIFQRPPVKKNLSQKLDTFFSSSSESNVSCVSGSPTSSSFLSQSNNSNNNQRIGVKSHSLSTLERSSMKKVSSSKIDTFFSPVNENIAVPILPKTPSNVQTNTSGPTEETDITGEVEEFERNDLLKEKEKFLNPVKNMDADCLNKLKRVSEVVQTGSVDNPESSLGVLKMNVLKLCDRNLWDLLKECTYINCIHFQNLLISRNNIIYSCDLKYFCEEFFYQFILDNFRKLDILPFLDPIPLTLLLEIGGQNNLTGLDIFSLTKTLKNAAAMLEDFFSISIDEKGNLKSIPMLIEQYVPSKRDLPTFILNLASKIKRDHKSDIIQGISREIAKYYSIIPSGKNLLYLIGAFFC